METHEPDQTVMKMALGIVISSVINIISFGALAYAQHPNGVIEESRTRKISPVPGDFSFDVTRHTVPLDEIHGGGPPKDGIPALVEPSFVSAAEVRSLHSQDVVLGVHLGASRRLTRSAS